MTNTQSVTRNNRSILLAYQTNIQTRDRLLIQTAGLNVDLSIRENRQISNNTKTLLQVILQQNRTFLQDTFTCAT